MAELLTLPALLDGHLAERPDAPAFIDGETPISYAEFDALCRKTAAWLTAQGVINHFIQLIVVLDFNSDIDNVTRKFKIQRSEFDFVFCGRENDFRAFRNRFTRKPVDVGLFVDVMIPKRLRMDDVISGVSQLAKKCRRVTNSTENRNRGRFERLTNSS